MKFLAFFFISTVALAQNPYVRVVDEKFANHSGVVIRSGTDIDVLTCAHMMFLQKSTNINIHFFNGDRYIGLPGDIIKRNDEADLMLVRVKNVANLTIEPVLVAGEISNNCVIKGWTGNKYRELNVTYKPSETYYNDVKLMTFIGKGESGMSGSPILSNGQIVSIQSLSNKKDGGDIVGAHLDEIRKFLK